MTDIPAECRDTDMSYDYERAIEAARKRLQALREQGLDPDQTPEAQAFEPDWSKP